MLSLPAIAGQAIEPLAQLMETAYIGQLGKFHCFGLAIGFLQDSRNGEFTCSHKPKCLLNLAPRSCPINFLMHTFILSRTHCGTIQLWRSTNLTMYLFKCMHLSDMIPDSALLTLNSCVNSGNRVLGVGLCGCFDVDIQHCVESI